jgi:hypothetical protein
MNIARLAHVAAGSDPPLEYDDFATTENVESDDGIAIGMGIDAAFAATKFHFDLFKKNYLTKLFPDCARELGLLSARENESKYLRSQAQPFQ